MAPLYQTLRRGDPDRFLALMAAPPDARGRLLPLYAFNLELARAPWLTAEPLIAAMRLQWWRDALEEIGAGRPPRAHEAVGPLAGVINAAGLPVALLDAMAAARQWDIDGEPFADTGALAAHLDATGGNLMWAAALALGAAPEAEPAVRGVARAGALAQWLLAVPVLAARGREALPDPAPEAVSGLARAGLGWLASARAARNTVPGPAVPALYPAWQAGALLAQAARDPARVEAGGLGLSEFSRRARLLWLAATGNW